MARPVAAAPPVLTAAVHRSKNDGTGLYYYRARYCQPGFGRFISGDPIGLAGGINIFVYVSGNPTNFIDPFGLEL
nr:RHS repeat-associated core domain-containing protein [Pseudomonas sp. GR 6-02]